MGGCWFAWWLALGSPTEIRSRGLLTVACLGAMCATHDARAVCLVGNCNCAAYMMWSRGRHAELHTLLHRLSAACMQLLAEVLVGWRMGVLPGSLRALHGP
jgi:putative SOS response-associated peptidase YedK